MHEAMFINNQELCFDHRVLSVDCDVSNKFKNFKLMVPCIMFQC